MNVMPNTVWKIYRYLDETGTPGRFSSREYGVSEKDFWSVAGCSEGLGNKMRGFVK